MIERPFECREVKKYNARRDENVARSKTNEARL